MRKGIVLAGGSGTRLYPVTEAISKQMAPVFDKPMIYYPLSVLFLSCIREIAIVSTPEHLPLYKNFLGDGSRFGVTFEYILQPSPDGLAQAYILSENFLDGAPSALVLGDNLFFGHSLPEMLMESSKNLSSSTVFCSQVSDPERFGVIEINKANSIISIEEKPIKPKSSYAVTGLYFLDSQAVEIAKTVRPSTRGEFEITSILSSYIENQNLQAKIMKRGFAWFDTGTHTSLLKASNFVETIQTQQGMMIACLEEIAFNNGWLSESELSGIAKRYSKSQYGLYLQGLLKK